MKACQPQVAVIEEGGYKCKQCSKEFRRGAALRRHMDYDHTEKVSEDEDAGVIDLDDEEYQVEEVESEGEGAEVTDVDDDEEKEADVTEVGEGDAQVSPAKVRNPEVNTQSSVPRSKFTKSGGSSDSRRSLRPFSCQICRRRFKEVHYIFLYTFICLYYISVFNKPIDKILCLGNIM